MENQVVEMKQKNTKKKKSKKKIIIIGAIVLAVVLAAFLFLFPQTKKNQIAEITYVENLVQRRTIQTTLSSSGTLQPADSYTVTSSVSGDILECSFEEGDLVNKDDTLYVVDSSDMENTIDRAQISYDKTLRNYNKIVESLEDLSVYSDSDGIITEVYVEVGDDINTGAKIAELRNSDTVYITVPFAAEDAKTLHVSQKGNVVIDGSFESRVCTIEEIDSFDTEYGGRAVRYVKVSVDNREGGIFKSTLASVNFGDTLCIEMANFEYENEKTITSKVSGTVTSVISRGGRVKADETLVLRLESENLEENFKDAQASLDDAQLSFDNTKEKLNDYTIKAPITGTVIEKYSKAGDTLDATRGQTTMAMIYDLSYLKFDMALDELDISLVDVGQKVMITCDALNLRGIEGEITKVSVVGTTSYNSTTYPVTVKVYNPPKGLLAGMNVDAELIIEEAENVLTVPTSAIQRGNVVYVKDDGTKKEDDNAPAGYMSVRVETGISNENYIEIKSGELDEGDTVYIPQAVRATTDGLAGMFGGMGQMPNMGKMPNMGSMPSMGGGMPGGNMGQRPSGNMSGQRPSGNMGGGFR